MSQENSKHIKAVLDHMVEFRNTHAKMPIVLGNKLHTIMVTGGEMDLDEVWYRRLAEQHHEEYIRGGLPMRVIRELSTPELIAFGKYLQRHTDVPYRLAGNIIARVAYMQDNYAAHIARTFEGRDRIRWVATFNLPQFRKDIIWLWQRLPLREQPKFLALVEGYPVDVDLTVVDEVEAELKRIGRLNGEEE